MKNPNRISHFYYAADKCKLAVDLYFPASVTVENGKVLQYKKKMPVIVKGGYDPRRKVYDLESHAIDRFTESGFAVAIVEQRGGAVHLMAAIRDSLHALTQKILYVLSMLWQKKTGAMEKQACMVGLTKV